MKTKAEIVKSLLEEKKIDVEEAMVLLMGEEKTIQYIPYPYNPSPVCPVLPYYPAGPVYVGSTYSDTMTIYPYPQPVCTVN